MTKKAEYTAEEVRELYADLFVQVQNDLLYQLKTSKKGRRNLWAQYMTLERLRELTDARIDNA